MQAVPAALSVAAGPKPRVLVTPYDDEVAACRCVQLTDGHLDIAPGVFDVGRQPDTDRSLARRAP